MSDGNRPKGLADFLIDELRSALVQSRTELIDRGWFGREVTPGLEQDAPMRGLERGAEGRPRFEDLWGRAARDVEHAERDRSRDGHEIER
jgi:hypothetical protein